MGRDNMKQKSGLLWWLRRRNIAKTRAVPREELKNIEVQVDSNNIESKEKNDTPPTPIEDIPIINNETEKGKKIEERELPIKKNERITIIKPKRHIGIDEHPFTPDDNDEKPIEKENKKKNEINKIFINEETVLNDVTIDIDTLDEIEKMLIKNYNEIQAIKYELDLLEKQEDDTHTKYEIEILLEELKLIIKKFEQIKKDFYSSNFEEIYNHSDDNNYIGLLINEYKNAVKNNELSEDVINGIKQIEEYITLINDIIEVETKKDDVEKKLDDKKEKLGIRDNEFEDMKIEYSNIEKMNNYIDGFSNEYNIIIKDIENKVAKSEEIKKTAEYKSELVVNHNRLLISTLLLAATPAIPFTRGGNLLKMGLMMSAIGGISSSFRVRTKESKVTTQINFTDYAKEIQTSINSVQDMSLMIDKTRLDIKNIREEFIREFGEYINQIPEYYDLISNLDKIEKDLLVKASIAKEYDQKLEDVLEQNNVKVKRLEDEIIN